jgi:glycosyltransferase involved in cell wall biosynthesis
MHILVTTDTVGGVWSYTRELVTGLVTRGVRVTLVSFGGVPSRAQRAWLAGLHGVRYYPTGFRLEWMQEAEEDVSDSALYLLRVIGECKPDLLHLSQYCFGSLEVGLPKIMVAHSDVMSWSQTVRGEQPRDAWAEWYRGIVERGVAGATTLVAPSRWMLDCFEDCYGRQPRSCVIYNGRTPALFNPFASKQDFAASAGRLWDEGKQTGLLLRLAAPLRIHLAGSTSPAGDSTGDPAGAAENASNVRFEGQLDEAGMCELLSRAAIYIAPSRYEPFGLAPLEAALSRCAIVANDISSFQEVWGDAAVYFRRDDVESLREVLSRLQDNPDMRMEYANRAHKRALERYTAERMVDEYMQLYSALLERRASAA